MSDKNVLKFLPPSGPKYQIYQIETLLLPHLTGLYRLYSFVCALARVPCPRGTKIVKRKLENMLRRLLLLPGLIARRQGGR